MGIKDADPGTLHTGKALQRRLAGIAGGGHQNGYGLVRAALFGGGGQQAGQHLQGKVLKGAGGAVPQLQAPGAGPEPAHRSDVRVVELTAVSLLNEGVQLLLGVIGQKTRQNGLRYLAVVHPGHGLDLFRQKGGQLCRRIQASVFRKPSQDGLCGSDPQVTVARTAKFHGIYLLNQTPAGSQKGADSEICIYTLS